MQYIDLAIRINEYDNVDYDLRECDNCGQLLTDHHNTCECETFEQ